MNATLKYPVKLHQELQRRCLNASAEHRKSLAPAVLRQIEMAQVTAWIDTQDETVNAANLIAQVHAAMNAIDARYPPS